jgi:DnaJ-class molecular chaperone
MSDNKEKKTCWSCSGRGNHERSRLVPDTAIGAALGAALGMGYFPSMKTEYYKETCSYCNGTGKI